MKINNYYYSEIKYALDEKRLGVTNKSLKPFKKLASREVRRNNKAIIFNRLNEV